MKSSTETVLWAGSIVRYHNRPTAQRQTVGEHTWRVMAIYTDLYGIPSNFVYSAMLYHDVAEIITGDVPFMAKRRSKSLKRILDDMEEKALSDLGLPEPDLTEEEEKQIKIADLLEMLFFAVDDVQMGCQFSIDIIKNILEVLPHDQKITNYIQNTGYQRAINTICAARES